MRALLAGLLGVAALACTAFAIPATWVVRHIVDEDGYVAFVEPLGEDAAFQSALATTVTDELVRNGTLPDRVAALVRPVVARVAGRLPQIDGYGAAWSEANRRSHRSLFADERDLPADADTTDRLTIDIAPLAGLLVDRVNQLSGVDLAVPDRLLVPVGGNNERQVVDRLKGLDPSAYVLLVLAAVLAVTSVLVARRRSTALAFLGLGLVGVAGLLVLVGDAAVDRLIDDNTTRGALGASAESYLRDASLESFHRWLLAVAIVGFAAAVVGGVSRVVSGRREPSASGRAVTSGP